MYKREARKPPSTPASKPRKQKTSEDRLPLDTMKEGSFRKQLKLKEDDPSLKITEIRKMLKSENGKDFNFRGKQIKMTPLLRKRGNLAITLMKLPKK